MPDRFEVTNAHVRLLRRRTRFGYAIRAARHPASGRVRTSTPSTRTSTSAASATRSSWAGIRARRAAVGPHALDWPLGPLRRPARRRRPDGRRRPTASPCSAATVPPSMLAARGRATPRRGARSTRSADPRRRARRRRAALHGSIPEWIDVCAPSSMATPTTYVAFEGRTAYGERSTIPFHVTSADWQESDRVLAGIMTAFGAPHHGRRRRRHGRVRRRDAAGVPAAAHRRALPRRAPARVGRHWGTRQRRSGHREQLRVDDQRARHRRRRASSRPTAASRSATRARTAARRSTRASARRAGRWPTCATRSCSTTGRSTARCPASSTCTASTRRRSASADCRSTRASAYDEPFETATASLRFEGSGVRLDGIEAPRPAGAMTGAAYVGWDGTYSFNVTGRRIPVETRQRAELSAGASCRACWTSPAAAAACSSRRATTCGSASPTSTSRTKASAR